MFSKTLAYRLRSRLGLLLWQHVQLVEVRLDVAVGEDLRSGNAQDLAHGLIWVDGVTLLRILQLVRIDVGREGAGDIRWGHLRALGLAEERAQLILEGDGGGEDSRALLLDHAILSDLGATALAARGLLDLLGNTLLQALKRLDGSNRGIALLLEDGDQARDLLLDGLGLGLRDWGSN